MFLSKYRGKHKSRENIHKIVSKFQDVTLRVAINNMGKKEKKNCSRCRSQKPSGSVHAVGNGWWGQQEVSGVWWTRW
jgi:hypothetical protein